MATVRFSPAAHPVSSMLFLRSPAHRQLTHHARQLGDALLFLIPADFAFNCLRRSCQELLFPSANHLRSELMFTAQLRHAPLA